MTVNKHKEEGEDASLNTAKGDQVGGPWRRLFQDEPDRVIELIFAGAVVIFAFLGWRNAQSNTQQTQQLITAAGISAKAATDNVIASRNFADSARGINQGVSDAVNRLQAQANAIEASRESSQKASAQALQSTIEHFHTEQRAWIAVERITATAPNDPSMQTGAQMLVRNTGKTPALNLRIRLFVEPLPTSTYNPLFSAPIDFPEDFKEIMDSTAQTNSSDSRPVVAPNASYSMSVQVPKQELPTIPPALHFTYTWYLHGRISYTDIFRKDHWLVICEFLQTTGKKFVWSPCSSHNAIDDDEN